jgi:hypothetical protein
MSWLNNPVVRVIVVLILLLALVSNPTTIEALLLRIQTGLVAVAGTLTLGGVLYGVVHLFHKDYLDHAIRQIIGSLIGGALVATLPQWYPAAVAAGQFLVGILVGILGSFHG